MQQVAIAYQRGAWSEAERLCRLVLSSKPDYFDALHVLGVIAAQTQRTHEAVELLSRAVSIDPNSAVAHGNHGNALLHLGRAAEALESYERALKINPGSAETCFNRGNALRDLKRPEEALESFERALKIKPDYADACNNRGTALLDLRRPGEALASFERALKIKPELAAAHNNRGTALLDLKRPEEALASCELALRIAPGLADACNNRGNALLGLKRPEEALASYERALKIRPDYADACNNHGNVLLDLKRPEEALASYERALKLKPDCDFLYGAWLGTRLRLSDWTDFQSDISVLLNKVACGEKAAQPFDFLALSSSSPLQRKAAEIWAREKFPMRDALREHSRRSRHGKIRIGYFSADYHNHATMYLLAEVFEKHDRSKFEVIAFSFGPNKTDEMRERVTAAFDEFIEVRNRSDEDVARLSRELEVDIAVDLKGYTQDSRPGIFASRAAPLQVNYLGYPGTMGVEYIDYMIADSTLVPEAEQHHYSEKIAYLPDSYQANDTRRRISDRAFTREECGLPKAGFVFCCFNSNYKISPATFDGWIRILKQVEGSVLWLLEENARAAGNLAREAGLRGCNPERLIFAKRLPLSEHLARYRLADLFLDTLPCNAHTTASDALWAGLPVLTCMDQAFASRVAASLLNAIRLPELVASTQAGYEARAIELATNPEKLGQMAQRLAHNRDTTPLFDTPRFIRHLERAYTEMYERYQADLPPDHIHVRS